MPLLLILGAGALLGVGAYLGVHGIAHVLHHFGVNWPIVRKLDGPITPLGTLASLAIGAAALPLAIEGLGFAGAALGVEFLPGAIGGAAATVATVGGDIFDHLGFGHHDKPAPKPVPVVTPAPKPTPTPDPAPVVTETTTANPPLPVPAPAPDVATVTTYVVSSGDTLWGIAEDHHVSLAALEKANPQIGDRKPPAPYTSPWDYILPGEAVEIPVAKTAGVTAVLGKIADPGNP